MTPDEVHAAETLLRSLARAREHLAAEQAAPDLTISSGHHLIDIVHDNRLPPELLHKVTQFARGVLVDHHSTEIERMTKELRALGVGVSK